jgi:hypothetical protein
LERTGASIRLDPRLWPKASVVQEERVAGDPYLTTINENFNDKEGKISTNEVWKLFNLAPGYRTQVLQMRINNAMRSLGWSKTTIKVKRDNQQIAVNGFIKGGGTHKEIVIKDGRVCNLEDESPMGSPEG